MLACSLNLMSCYLKTNQHQECIKEGSEVLAYDATNIKALYRRGQAYRDLSLFQDAVSDLSKAHEVSPEDETIADVLRDVKERLAVEGPGKASERGIILFLMNCSKEYSVFSQTRRFLAAASMSRLSTIGETTEKCFLVWLLGVVIEENTVNCRENKKPSKEVTGTQRESNPGGHAQGIKTDLDGLQALRDDPEAIRTFQNFNSKTDPDTLAALSGGKAGDMSPDMFKTASSMIGKMSPEEIQKMVQTASSFKGENPFASTAPSAENGFMPTPDMLKLASDMMSKMSPEERERMFNMASSLKANAPVSTSYRDAETAESHEASGISSFAGESSRGSEPSIPSAPPADLQEQMRKQMKDPAMRQMFTSMIKNMNPEMMASMSEQFGMKLSQEDAAKAQEAMASLSPEALEKMMRWADRAQTGIEKAKKAKKWLLGKSGLIFAGAGDKTTSSEGHLISAAAFVQGGIQDPCDDACSICLEVFCDSDPSTLPVGVDNAEIEERIIQHLAAAAAMGRARHGVRREGHRSRSSTQGVHPHLRVFSPPPPPMPSSPSQRDESDTVTNLPLSHQNTLGEGSFQSNMQPPTSSLPRQVSPSNNRSLNQSSPSDQDRAGPSELQSFSESLKSRLNAVSTRYKESISKNTRSWKDRFFSRNTSMADLGSEVKREVSAGIATVSRLMERLETRENSSRPGNEPVSPNGSGNNNPPAESNNEHNRRSEGGDEHSLNERGVKGTCAAASSSS
ncbi:hypothetical protein Bca4012_025649 [Brassica carinata]